MHDHVGDTSSALAHYTPPGGQEVRLKGASPAFLDSLPSC